MKSGYGIATEDTVLQSITRTGTAFYVFVCALLVLTAEFLYAWYIN